MATWRVLSRGGPASGVAGVDLRLATQGLALAQAALERARPGIARVSVHLCPHVAGEPPALWWNCRSDPRAEYTES